jgi:hypothetical protein
MPEGAIIGAQPLLTLLTQPERGVMEVCLCQLPTDGLDLKPAQGSGQWAQLDCEHEQRTWHATLLLDDAKKLHRMEVRTVDDDTPASTVRIDFGSSWHWSDSDLASIKENERSNVRKAIRKLESPLELPIAHLKPRKVSDECLRAILRSFAHRSAADASRIQTETRRHDATLATLGKLNGMEVFGILEKLFCRAGGMLPLALDSIRWMPRQLVRPLVASWTVKERKGLVLVMTRVLRTSEPLGEFAWGAGGQSGMRYAVTRSLRAYVYSVRDKRSDRNQANQIFRAIEDSLSPVDSLALEDVVSLEPRELSRIGIDNRKQKFDHILKLFKKEKDKILSQYAENTKPIALRMVCKTCAATAPEAVVNP